jgi:hypothetical protein
MYIHCNTCRIWGSDNDGYEAFCRMGYTAEYVERQPTFQGNISLPSSRVKNKPNSACFLFHASLFLGLFSTMKMEVKYTFETIYCNIILIYWHSQTGPTFIHLSHENSDQFKVWLFFNPPFFRITIFSSLPCVPPTDKHCTVKQLF